MFSRSVDLRRPAFLLGLAIVFTACGGKDASRTGAPAIRVGYFPNITHSQAILGLARGDFQRALPSGVTIETTLFNAGPSVIEALFAGRIDLAYIGPNPALNGYIQSDGKALRIVAGATSGGAALVVRKAAGIRRAEDFAGKHLATPQLGNTQDVALRDYLREHGHTPTEVGGTVEVIPTANPQILDLFLQGRIDGAWVPEPWASRLEVEGDGEVFLDERELWPKGEFVTALVIVATPYLQRHPEMVRAWLRAHVEVTEWEQLHPEEALPLLNAEIEKLTGKKFADLILTRAWSRLRPTWDPLSESLRRSAQAAHAAGFLKREPELEGICALDLLNEILREKGLPEVR